MHEIISLPLYVIQPQRDAPRITKVSKERLNARTRSRITAERSATNARIRIHIHSSLFLSLQGNHPRRGALCRLHTFMHLAHAFGERRTDIDIGHSLNRYPKLNVVYSCPLCRRALCRAFSRYLFSVPYILLFHSFYPSLTYLISVPVMT